MEFEWDEAKAASNFAKHSVKFSDAAVALLTGTVVRKPDTRRDYGEDRWIALARAFEAILSIVYTTRRDSIRIISALEQHPFRWNRPIVISSCDH